MKKITFFICSLSSGGAEHQLSILANFLQEKKYEISIITFADEADHYHLNDGIKRIRITSKGSPIRRYIEIFKYLLKVKTDCFISFGQRENFISLIPFLFRRKIKFIAGERNFTIGTPSKYEKVLMTVLYKRANYIVPNSFSQNKHIVENNKRYRQKTITITNFTDLDEYKFVEKQEENPLKIGIFCRYESQKNCHRFIDAIYELKKRTKHQFLIEWYGNRVFSNSISQNYYNVFCEKINELNLQDIVILHDSVKNVAELMSSYDAICLPSLHEGFSNTISEGICCGKIMLVSDVSDNPVMVKDGENGFLFDPYSVSEIVIAFEKFFTLTPEQRKSFGKKSRSIAEMLFSKDKFVKSYISLIES